MKITSAVIIFITAATAVWGATLKSRAHHGTNMTSRARARTHAGINKILILKLYAWLHKHSNERP